MPRINLLPIKAARRVDTARQELIGVAIALGICFFGYYSWWASVDSEIEDVRDSIGEVQVEITELDRTVAKVRGFKGKSEALEQKLEVIETLKKKKVGPAKMLDDIATILTQQQKVWLTAILTDPKDGRLSFRGGAMSHENVSEFQLALQRQSVFFTDVKLTLVSTAKDGDIEYVDWVISVIPVLAPGSEEIALKKEPKKK